MHLAFAISVCLATAALAASAEQKVVGADPLGEAKRQFLDGRPDAALTTLANAEKSGEPDAATLSLRGCVYLEQGKFDSAMADFRAAVVKNPSFFPPRLHLGDALLRQKKWEDARAAYDEALKQTNILIFNEQLRYGILLSHLGAKNEAGARNALARITFPTESPTYYYAQAASAFARGNQRAARKWLQTAGRIFREEQTAWFARPLYDLGWIKTKPPPVID